jgi:hypothetical protein
MKPKRILVGYIMVCSNDDKQLCQFVMEWSEEGYELYGSPFVNDEGKGLGQEICQAMVKYDD